MVRIRVTNYVPAPRKLKILVWRAPDPGCGPLDSKAEQSSVPVNRHSDTGVPYKERGILMGAEVKKAKRQGKESPSLCVWSTVEPILSFLHTLPLSFDFRSAITPGAMRESAAKSHTHTHTHQKCYSTSAFTLTARGFCEYKILRKQSKNNMMFDTCFKPKD